MDASAPMSASLDGTAFEFEATGDGNRVVVSSGMRKLLGHKYWIPIQKTCPDLQPAGNNRDSVPTKWLMNVTANPPTFVKPKHRLVLRMVHLICLDALAEGANFRSDKVFARETPVLQVERNVLESPEYWEPVVEVSTASAKGQNKRRREEEDDDDDTSSSDGDDKAPAPKRRKPLLLFGPDVTDLAVIDETIISSTSANEREHFGLPLLRGLFYESTSVMDFVKGLFGLRMLGLKAKHMELDQNSSRATAEKDATAKREQEEADVKYKREQGQKDAEAKREQEEADVKYKRDQDQKDAEAKREQDQKDAAAKIDREEKQIAAKIEREEKDAEAKREQDRKDIEARLAREEKDAEAKREQDRKDVEARLAREEKDADAKHEQDQKDMEAKRARDDADAAVKRETAQEREHMEIVQAEKQLELDRKANYKQGGEQRMRKPGKHLLFTDQRADRRILGREVRLQPRRRGRDGRLHRAR